jgi:PEP-CTERM motif
MSSKGSRLFSSAVLLVALTLACVDGAKADSFSTGEFVTYNEGDWGAGGAEASLLAANYDSLYAGTNDVLTEGVTGNPSLYFLEFTSAGAVLTYLPASGTPAPLTTSILNPATSPSGLFGGDVLALTLNIDFNNAGLLGSASSIPFNDLLLTNFTGSLSGLNGLTVNQFLATANTWLSSGSCPYGLQNIATITDDLNASFEGGTVSTFADDYLDLPSSGSSGSGTTVPEPSSLILLVLGLAAVALLGRRFQN